MIRWQPGDPLPRAVTVRQPGAWFVTTGRTRLVFASVPPPDDAIGGEVLVFAGAKPLLRASYPDVALRSYLGVCERLDAFGWEALPANAFVATALVEDTVFAEDLDEVGPWAPPVVKGSWAWVLAEVEPIVPPWWHGEPSHRRGLWQP